MALADVAAGAHGIIVEIHKKPEQAETEGQQTLDFAQFAELMKRVRAIEVALK